MGTEPCVGIRRIQGKNVEVEFEQFFFRFFNPVIPDFAGMPFCIIHRLWNTPSNFFALFVRHVRN